MRRSCIGLVLFLLTLSSTSVGSAAISVMLESDGQVVHVDNDGACTCSNTLFVAESVGGWNVFLDVFAIDTQTLMVLDIPTMIAIQGTDANDDLFVSVSGNGLGNGLSTYLEFATFTEYQNAVDMDIQYFADADNTLHATTTLLDQELDLNGFGMEELFTVVPPELDDEFSFTIEMTIALSAMPDQFYSGGMGVLATPEPSTLVAWCGLSLFSGLAWRRRNRTHSKARSAGVGSDGPTAT